MYFFIKKSCLLTDKIKKSSINTAPNGRMPAIRLLKSLQTIVLWYCTIYYLLVNRLHNKKYTRNNVSFVFQYRLKSSLQVTINHARDMQPHLDRFRHFKLKSNPLQKLCLTKKKFLLSLPWQRTHIPGLVRNLARNLIGPNRVFIGLYKTNIMLH